MEFPQVERADADALTHFLTANEWPFHVRPKLGPDDVRDRPHDSVGYAILRRDWQTGTTTAVNWADE
jgi:hypothetical protein